MKNLYVPRRLELESLERRVLFSASPAPDPVPDGAASEAVVAEPVQESSGTTEQEGQAPPPSESSPGENGTQSDNGGSSGAGGSADAENVIHQLEQQQLEVVAQAAAELWKRSGLDSDQLQRLSNIVYSVENFQGSILGDTVGNHISLDRDAAGSGWFVDPTPLSNEEFVPGSGENHLLGRSGGAQSAIDLLSVLLHEQGHILGLQNLGPDSANVMDGGISLGERTLPLPGQADGSAPFFLDSERNFLASASLTLDPPVFPSEVLPGETIFIAGTFQNPAGIPVTVALLDKDGNTIDSVDISPPDTSYALSAPTSETGLQKFTIFLFDPLFPDTVFDKVEIEVLVKGEEPVIIPAVPPAVSPPAVSPPAAVPVVQEEVPELAQTVTTLVPGVVTPISGNGIFSYSLLDTGSIFSLPGADSIEILIFGQNDAVLGISILTLTGDFNPISSVTFLNQLAINFEPLGLSRIEVKHANGLTTFNYIAGVFYEVEIPESAA